MILVTSYFGKRDFGIPTLGVPKNAGERENALVYEIALVLYKLSNSNIELYN
jgi:hypothetical protein